jgi:hypothetical protein
MISTILEMRENKIKTQLVVYRRCKLIFISIIMMIFAVATSLFFQQRPYH